MGGPRPSDERRLHHSTPAASIQGAETTSAAATGLVAAVSDPRERTWRALSVAEIRPEVRLDDDLVDGTRGVHNHGQGGHGVTLS